ncbi:MAG: sulfatase-like hydrolase/transferase [Phycisphaerae bacterium]|nr:sulfatase-like hydrolase/transferase [Phycisphaerae bacterium]
MFARYLLVLALLGPCAAFAADDARSQPLNFVVIMADDLGAGELGCYGNTEHRTPRLDALAKSGIRFRTCWATPLCSPTRVEILTGRYGFRTGWYNFLGRVTTPLDHLNPDEPTFADVLKAKGYATALAGKWQLGTITKQPKMIFDSGFDTYCTWAWIELPKDAKFAGSPRQRYWHPAVITDGKHQPTSPEQYGPNVYCNWLIEFMRKNRDRPFLAYYPMCLTHKPWDPTPSLTSPGKKTEKGLKPNVEYMDHLVGRIADALDELGIRDRTVIFFTGDNGTAGRGKGQTTELGVRVPMIVNCLKRIKPGVSEELVDLSDILPTLAELAHADLPAGVTIDGHSFAPLLLGGKWQPREWIFSYLAYDRILRDKRWLLEGDGRFYDCGTSRDGTRYKDVTDSTEPDAAAARKRFEAILSELPGPERPAGQPKARNREKR